MAGNFVAQHFTFLKFEIKQYFCHYFAEINQATPLCRFRSWDIDLKMYTPDSSVSSLCSVMDPFRAFFPTILVRLPGIYLKHAVGYVQ